MRVFLILISLIGCSKPIPINIVSFPTPIYASCDPTPPAVPLPKQPRTFDSVVDWAKKTEIQRLKTVYALNECRKLLQYSQEGK